MAKGTKVVVHGRDNKIQSEQEYGKQKKYRLVKDFVIPAGTEFYEVVKMVEHRPMNTNIGLSNDSVMSCSSRNSYCNSKRSYRSYINTV